MAGLMPMGSCRTRRVLWLAILTIGTVRPLRVPAPREDTILRRSFLQASALCGGASVFGAAGLIASQVQRLLEPAVAGVEYTDPLAATLRSSTGLEARLERRKLEEEWLRLRELRESGRIGRLQTETAFATVLRVRREIGRAAHLAEEHASNWQLAIEQVVTQPLVQELEGAATLLASSPLLDAESRAAIGWQWGACGWRQCGAQSDAAQAMSKLRINLGMLTPLEARYYLDVAIRAVDEVLFIGASAGYVRRKDLPRADYLPTATLDSILAVDEVGEEEEEGRRGAPAEGPHKVLGTRLRAEKMWADLEEAAIREAGELEDEGSGGLAWLMGDDD